MASSCLYRLQMGEAHRRLRTPSPRLEEEVDIQDEGKGLDSSQPTR